MGSVKRRLGDVTLVSEFAVCAIRVDGGPSDGQLGFVLEITGTANKLKSKREHQLALSVGQFAELLTDVVFVGASASREFASELDAAIAAGVERLRREGPAS